MGAGRIVATDALAHRVEAALASGADEAHLTTVGGQPAGIDGWDPVDVAFEAAGEDAALESALIHVRLGGRVVVVGIPPTNRHSFTARPARGKGLTLAFSRRMKAIHMLRAIELVDHGIVQLDGLITGTYPMSQAATAFDALVARSELKLVVSRTPDEQGRAGDSPRLRRARRAPGGRCRGWGRSRLPGAPAAR
jgi:L-iditol 2-dehydrogenase